MPCGGRLVISTSNYQAGAGADPACLLFEPGNYVVLTLRQHSAEDGALEGRSTHDSRTGFDVGVIHGILKRYGGYVEELNHFGGAPGIRVYLPEYDSKEDSSDQTLRFEADDYHPTVLLVEDEEAVRNLITEILNGVGFKVVASPGGRQALEVLQNNSESIGLLLTDVVMPEMSGRELVRKVHQSYPGIPILYMSGYTPEVASRYGVNLDAGDLLVKPFSSSALVAKVQEVLAPPVAS